MEQEAEKRVKTFCTLELLQCYARLISGTPRAVVDECMCLFIIVSCSIVFVVGTCCLNVMWNRARLMTALRYCWVTENTDILRQLLPLTASDRVHYCTTVLVQSPCFIACTFLLWPLCWVALLFTDLTSLLNTMTFMVQTWPPCLALVLPLYWHDPPS